DIVRVKYRPMGIVSPWLWSFSASLDLATIPQTELSCQPAVACIQALTVAGSLADGSDSGSRALRHRWPCLPVPKMVLPPPELRPLCRNRGGRTPTPLPPLRPPGPSVLARERDRQCCARGRRGSSRRASAAARRVGLRPGGRMVRVRLAHRGVGEGLRGRQGG